MTKIGVLVSGGGTNLQAVIDINREKSRLSLPTMRTLMV